MSANTKQPLLIVPFCLCLLVFGLWKPGFLTLTPGAMAEKSHILDLAAQANITISALDARGLYTTEIDASERGGSSAQDLMTGQHAQYHSDTMTLDEDVVSELADGTGGTLFHNSNDLAGGLKSLAQGPEYLYLLEFSPEKFKPDGSYHRLKVKVNRDGLKVEARRGYCASAAKEQKVRLDVGALTFRRRAVSIFPRRGAE
jgi:VWFA-related protein